MKRSIVLPEKKNSRTTYRHRIVSHTRIQRTNCIYHINAKTENKIVNANGKLLGRASLNYLYPKTHFCMWVFPSPPSSFSLTSTILWGTFQIQLRLGTEREFFLGRTVIETYSVQFNKTTYHATPSHALVHLSSHWMIWCCCFLCFFFLFFIPIHVMYILAGIHICAGR